MADTPRTLRRTRTSGDLTLTFIAGEFRIVPRWGRAYTCLSVTTDSKVLVGLNQTPVDAIIKGIGDSVAYDEPDFSELWFQNTDVISQTVTLRTSFGVVSDNRLNLVSGTIPTSLVGPTAISSAAGQVIGAAASLDVAANASRKGLTIYHSTAGATIWFRDQSATVNGGVEIGPGNVFSAPDGFTGAYRLRNNSAGAVTVYVTEWT